jgi:hypothetical protein
MSRPTLNHVRASPLFHAKLGAPNGIWRTLICPSSTWFGRGPTGTHHSSTAQARTASLSPHCSHSEWTVGFVNTIPNKKLPDSLKSRHGESSPGLWRMASGSKNIRSPASKFGLARLRWDSVWRPATVQPVSGQFGVEEWRCSKVNQTQFIFGLPYSSHSNLFVPSFEQTNYFSILFWVLNR